MKALHKNNLLTVMNQMRSLVPPETPAPECEIISWTVPHHFTAEAQTIILDFSNKLGIHLQQMLQELCDSDATVSFTGMTEHFTTVLFSHINQERKDCYYLPVKAGRNTVGFLELPYETCTKLIALMLKNPQAEIGREGELSPLEESILMDVAGPMADAMINGFIRQGGQQVTKADLPVKGGVLERFGDLDDACQLSFEITGSSGTLLCSLYMLDELIDPLVGIAKVDRSPETLRKMPERVIECLQDVSMDVSVRLSAAMMDLHDILMLEKDDVLVLERKISMPADVLVNGRHCFDAWPARHNGHGAVVMTEPKKIGQ
jgi:flagellar motor switch/type III secretory pathway protein FliN